MERKYKIYITSITFLLFIALTIVFLLFKQSGLCIISITILIILMIYIVSLIISDNTTKNTYRADLKYVLKTYKNILVKSLDLIDISKKNIIRTDNIEDLINAQVEVRKPIYYKVYDGCTTFIIIDNDIALVYVIKESDEIKDPTEFFTEDAIINLNEIMEDKVIDFRDKQIILNVINKLDDKEGTSLLESKKINKKRRKSSKEKCDD